MGQRWEPTTRWYHSQASGLMGSPTVPSTCKDARLCLGQESGREDSSEYHQKPKYTCIQHPCPSLFQVRESRRQKEATQRPVLGSEGHLWNSRLRGDSLGDRLISKLHEHPDCCWCCVELGHLVFVHNAPQAALIWICGDPLKLPPVKSGYFWPFPIVLPLPYHSLRFSICPF